MSYRNLDKTLPDVPILYMPEYMDLGGWYHTPEPGHIVVHEDREYDASKGIIIICGGAIGYEEAVLAHEWRHHWQAYHGLLPEWDWPWIDKGNWLESRLHYYQAWHELDAFMFEMKFAQDLDEYQQVLSALGHTAPFKEYSIPGRFSVPNPTPTIP